MHNVFRSDANKEEDPIVHKNLRQKKGKWALKKELLGFVFY